MTLSGWITIAVFFLCVVALTRPLGGFLKRVLEAERHFLGRMFGPLERGIYHLAGVDPTREQSWSHYALAVILFKIFCFIAVYALLRLQGVLPLNPAGLGVVAPDLAYNTAISFLTNTNWQSYGGETTLSPLSQMLALTVQNFVSAAAGIAIAAAIMRGFVRRSTTTIGNFWVDLVRVTLYVLLPACELLTLFFVLQGVPQTLWGSVTAFTLEGHHQTIALGPVASQEAIKMLGTNGGGFFNTNSAHPFENPNALTNFVQMLYIFALGAGLTNMFGRMIGQEKQGWAIFSAMAALFLIGAGVLYWSEAHTNPLFASLGLDGTLGNMEGKEIRFGVVASALFATVTTDASCGAVNAMHESFLPLGGMVPLINMMLGEVIFGGVGSGLYGFLLFALIAVFMAGLMVGRTPEYLGKKIEAREIKMTMLAVLCLPLVMLGFTALAIVISSSGHDGARKPASAGKGDGKPHPCQGLGDRFEPDWAGFYRGALCPSATRGADPSDASKSVAMPYNAAASLASNAGPTSKALLEQVTARTAQLRAENPDAIAQGWRIPVELVTSSASGLDPDLSPDAAFFQIARVAKARELSPDRVRHLVKSQTEAPILGFLGEPHVNVLALNQALDRLGQ